jgi:hypothetical protein
VTGRKESLFCGMWKAEALQWSDDVQSTRPKELECVAIYLSVILLEFSWETCNDAFKVSPTNKYWYFAC